MQAFSSVSTIRLTDALNFGAVFCGCYYCWFVICSKDLTRNGCFVQCNYFHHSFCLISHMRDVFIIIILYICNRTYVFESVAAEIQMKIVIINDAKNEKIAAAATTTTQWHNKHQTVQPTQFVAVICAEKKKPHKIKSLRNPVVALSAIQYSTCYHMNKIWMQ